MLSVALGIPDIRDGSGGGITNSRVWTDPQATRDTSGWTRSRPPELQCGLLGCGRGDRGAPQHPPAGGGGPASSGAFSAQASHPGGLSLLYRKTTRAGPIPPPRLGRACLLPGRLAAAS